MEHGRRRSLPAGVTEAPWLDPERKRKVFDRLHDTVRAHAMDAYPEPACGAIFGTEDAPEYLPVTEVADRSREIFHVGEALVRDLEDRHGTMLAFVLSHPAADDEKEEVDPLLFTPSAAEMVAQVSLAVPFGVVVCNRSRSFEPWWFGDQCPIQRLLGRPFRHGVTDCFSLIRDWCRLERNILLPDFPRDWNWWLDGLDLYRMGFEQSGGRAIDQMEVGHGDVILFRIRSEVPNHAALVLSDGWIMHHLASFVPYDPARMSYWERPMRWHHQLATHWLRYHEDLT